MIVLSFAFAAFHIAEAATLSGIMSVLFYGIFMAHYGYHSLTDYSKVSSIAISKILGFLAEGFVYARKHQSPKFFFSGGGGGHPYFTIWAFLCDVWMVGGLQLKINECGCRID